MLLLLLDKPVGLILAYGVLGAIFMPFLAVTLLILLNRRGSGAAAADGSSAVVPPEWRNRWLSNALMVLWGVLFVALAVNEVKDLLVETF